VTNPAFGAPGPLGLVDTGDLRLNRVMNRAPKSCASINEYAAKTDIPTDEIIDLLGPLLEIGSLALEFVGGEVFVLTAPAGRPMSMSLPQVEANLWEVLRTRAMPQEAYELWKLIRGLERVGWVVENGLPRIMFGLAPVITTPLLGIEIGTRVVPVIVRPAADELSDPAGVLTDYNRAGAGAIAVVCENGQLDAMSTAMRRWTLSQTFRPGLSVLILEAPRYQPTMLTPGDAAVPARAVTQQTLSEWALAEEGRPPAGGYASYS
jgi:hypothetical protein